jgi:hypothetical protein
MRESIEMKYINEYCKETYNPDHSVTFTRTSMLTRITRDKVINGITPEAWEEYVEGSKTLQDYFSYISEDDREFIISGITSEEWDKHMTDEGAK